MMLASLQQAWIIWIEMFCALIAAVIGFAATLQLGSNTSPSLRYLNAGRSALALFYTFGYAWLILNPDKRLQWSEFFSGIAMITWPVVWIFPPLVSMQAQGVADRRLARAVLTSSEAMSNTSNHDRG